jgi:hypothetical protein
MVSTTTFGFAVRHVTIIAALLAASCAFAQNGSRITESAAPPSRWQQEVDALDQALRARALVSTDPRDLWIAAQLDAVDPWQRVAALAQARSRASDEKLFLAALAMACIAPLQPLPPECDATDRLADWATRDADNGVPSLLLADRARRRNNTASMVAFLEEAATRPRFDDYENRGALIVWDAVRALPGNVDPAARAQAAAVFGVAHASQVPAALQALCRDAARQADTIRAACAGAGNAAAQRGSTWSLRIAGAILAERAQAPDAQRQLADVQRRAFGCAEAGNPVSQALESADASVRAKGVAQWEARLVRDAKTGEVAACSGG